VPNEFSGQLVYLAAPEIVELFTRKAENTGSADDRDLDALAVEDLSVHGNPLFPLRLQRDSADRAGDVGLRNAGGGSAHDWIPRPCPHLATRGESFERLPITARAICDMSLPNRCYHQMLPGKCGATSAPAYIPVDAPKRPVLLERQRLASGTPEPLADSKQDTNS